MDAAAAACGCSGGGGVMRRAAAPPHLTPSDVCHDLEVHGSSVAAEVLRLLEERRGLVRRWLDAARGGRDVGAAAAATLTPPTQFIPHPSYTSLPSPAGAGATQEIPIPRGETDASAITASRTATDVEVDEAGAEAEAVDGSDAPSLCCSSPTASPRSTASTDASSSDATTATVLVAAGADHGNGGGVAVLLAPAEHSNASGLEVSQPLIGRRSSPGAVPQPLPAPAVEDSSAWSPLATVHHHRPLHGGGDGGNADGGGPRCMATSVSPPGSTGVYPSAVSSTQYRASGGAFVTSLPLPWETRVTAGGRDGGRDREPLLTNQPHGNAAGAVGVASSTPFAVQPTLSIACGQGSEAAGGATGTLPHGRSVGVGAGGPTQVSPVSVQLPPVFTLAIPTAAGDVYAGDTQGAVANATPLLAPAGGVDLAPETLPPVPDTCLAEGCTDDLDGSGVLGDVLQDNRGYVSTVPKGCVPVAVSRGTSFEDTAGVEDTQLQVTVPLPPALVAGPVHGGRDVLELEAVVSADGAVGASRERLATPAGSGDGSSRPSVEGAPLLARQRVDTDVDAGHDGNDNDNDNDTSDAESTATVLQKHVAHDREPLIAPATPPHETTGACAVLAVDTLDPYTMYATLGEDANPDDTGAGEVSDSIMPLDLDTPRRRLLHFDRAPIPLQNAPLQTPPEDGTCVPGTLEGDEAAVESGGADVGAVDDVHGVTEKLLTPGVGEGRAGSGDAAASADVGMVDISLGRGKRPRSAVDDDDDDDGRRAAVPAPPRADAWTEGGGSLVSAAGEGTPSKRRRLAQEGEGSPGGHGRGPEQPFPGTAVSGTCGSSLVGSLAGPVEEPVTPKRRGGSVGGRFVYGTPGGSTSRRPGVVSTATPTHADAAASDTAAPTTPGSESRGVTARTPVGRFLTGKKDAIDLAPEALAEAQATLAALVRSHSSSGGGQPGDDAGAGAVDAAGVGILPQRPPPHPWVINEDHRLCQIGHIAPEGGETQTQTQTQTQGGAQPRAAPPTPAAEVVVGGSPCAVVVWRATDAVVYRFACNTDTDFGTLSAASAAGSHGRAEGVAGAEPASGHAGRTPTPLSAASSDVADGGRPSRLRRRYARRKDPRRPLGTAALAARVGGAVMDDSPAAAAVGEGEFTDEQNNVCLIGGECRGDDDAVMAIETTADGSGRAGADGSCDGNPPRDSRRTADNVSMRVCLRATPPEGGVFTCAAVPADSQLVLLGTSVGVLLGYDRADVHESCPADGDDPHACALVEVFRVAMHPSDAVVNHCVYVDWSYDEVLVFTAATSCTRVSLALGVDGRMQHRCVEGSTAHLAHPFSDQGYVVHHLAILDQKRPLLAASASTAAAASWLLIWDFQQRALLRRLPLAPHIRRFATAHGAQGLSLIAAAGDSRGVAMSSWVGDDWATHTIAACDAPAVSWCPTPNTSYVFVSTTRHVTVHSLTTCSVTAEIKLTDAEGHNSVEATPRAAYAVTSIAFHPRLPLVCLSDSDGVVWVYLSQ